MKKFCPNCEECRVVELIQQEETFVIKDEEIKVVSEFYKCSSCNEDFHIIGENKSSLKEAYNIYRERHNMLKPEEIKNLRTKLCLTQAELAEISGMSVATINRYEKGNLQEKTHDILLRAFLKTTYLLELLEKSAFTEEKKAKIKQAYYKKNNSVISNKILNFMKSNKLFLEDGHFLLKSGKHSSKYFNLDKLLDYPSISNLIAEECLSHIDKPFDTVITPAQSGYPLAYSIAQANKNSRCLLIDGNKNIKEIRNENLFSVNDRVVIVDSVITSGETIANLLEKLNEFKLEIVAIGCVVNRKGSDLKVFSLLEYPVLETYCIDECPLCKSNIPLHDPRTYYDKVTFEQNYQSLLVTM